MTVLASGSRGNATVITGGRTRVLVDAGLSCRELMKRMRAAEEDPCALDAIVVTHEHQDHVQGLPVLARKLGIPVYFTEATHRAWMRAMRPQKRMSYGEWLLARKAEKSGVEGGGERVEDEGQGSRMEGHEAGDGGTSGPGPASAGQSPKSDREEKVRNEGQRFQTGAGPAFACAEVEAERRQEAEAEPVDVCALPGVEYFRAGKPFAIGDLEVTAFTIPHDAADPVGFVLGCEGVRIGVATDLGYIPANVCEQLRRCDVVMLESNHDLEMLRDGPYPWSVKQRVLSRVGHLSNAAAAEFLEKRYDGQAAYVVLAHLSESNNMPELAEHAAQWALRDRMSLLGNRLVVAGQHVPTESIRL